METLQDRRRRADQAVRLQLLRVENSIREQESRPESSEVRDGRMDRWQGGLVGGWMDDRAE